MGFSHREGLVLSNISYDDGSKGRRPLFYRLSIAEMVVPVSNRREYSISAMFDSKDAVLANGAEVR